MPTSLPYKFPFKAAVFPIESESTCLIVGGFTDSDSANMTDRCIFLELDCLVGSEFTKLPKPSAMQTLLLHREKNEIYAVGGIQNTPRMQSEALQSDYCMGTFCVLQKDVWRKLSQPEDPVCVPTCYIMNSKIYAAGGSKFSQDDLYHKDIQVYDIETDTWVKLIANFDIPIIGAIARPMPGDNVLLLGGRKINPENVSNHIYLMKGDGGTVDNTKEVQALELVAPCFEGEGRLFVYSENSELLVLNLKDLSSQVINVEQQFESGTNLSLVARNFCPPDRDRFCYHYSIDEGLMHEMNSQTLMKEAYPMLPPRLRDVGICHLDDGHLLLVGGVEVDTQEHTASDKCFTFDCLVKTQIDFRRLLKPQYGCRVLQIHNQIFVLAGKTQNPQTSCNQVCDIFDRKWRMLPQIPHSVWYPAVAQLENMIYIIGGETAQDGICDLIQVLNPASKTWKQLEVVFPVKAMKMSAFSIGGEIFIIGGKGDDGGAMQKWYKFDGQEVHVRSFGSNEVLEFNDPPCITAEKVYVFSSSGHCYILNRETSTWDKPAVEEIKNQV
jgi:hypothetical protein